MALSLAKYYRSVGNYKKSLDYRDVYFTLFEEIKEKQRNDIVYEFEEKYEAEKKEREITEQQLIILENKRQKNQFLVGLVVLAVLFIGALVFFRNRIKYQKTIAQQRAKLQNQKIIELQQENKIVALDSMLEGQEKERARIAQDLHDSLGGLLSSAKSYFQSTQTKEGGTRQRIEKTTSLIDEAASEVRRISHNMMPQALTISGVKDALNDIAEALKIEKYDVTFECKNLPELNSNQEIMVYRLIQELISNIKKHANASSVFIQLYAVDKEVFITVEDNGKGFDVNAIEQERGLGLESIKSRVAYLDGKVLWDSEIGKGTTVDISFAA